MMNDLRVTIREALVQSRDSDFQDAARELLKAMNYRSDREGPAVADADSFISQFPATNANTMTERDFLEEAESARVMFQVTDSEVRQSEQGSLFETSEFYKGNARSFLFVAVELKGRSYPRGRYARFTREINKRFPSPTVVLFRNADNLVTLAFVHRRESKVHSERDVLGSVSLIREIDTESPHRAHLNILADIALDNRLNWMDAHAKSQNFEGLLAAWLDALDTEELNRRFYRDLFQWFDRAVRIAKFPTIGNRVLPAEEHIIRLITRLMFVWFIKEKGLVANRLFVENQVREMLKDYDPNNGDSYYRAVLQNLFFATLNTEIDRRGFSNVDNSTHRDFSRYRYRAEMSDPNALLELFRQTPFINGGLFDCLDSEESTGDGGYRIDCFTDNPNHRIDYSIPNRLFFGDDGLITLFNRYKFTVEENTPVEREVALDPELLGKVFENLLAAFNPETRENARKQTGSYYTPRAIVDYMVDEALVASLAQKADPESSDAAWWEDRLRYLLDYGDAFVDADELFTSENRRTSSAPSPNPKLLTPLSAPAPSRWECSTSSP